MIRRKLIYAVTLTAGLLLIAVFFAGAQTGDAAKTRQAFQGKLPNVPGKSLTAVVVNYAPGGKSPVHHHAGSVFAYVLSGQIRSEVSTNGPVKVYSAGESFFEPPGSAHTVSENASPTEPASLLAVFVADDGATLTMPGK
jgi:quercetin dioxygenase-like cupin family protein